MNDGDTLNLDRVYDRWDELSDLVDQASALPADAVAAYCVEACGADQELYALLCKLLNTSESADAQIRSSIAAVAERAAMNDSLIGESVGPYQLDALLGRGGMGEVYLASRADGQFEKKVAVKIVRRRLPSEASAELFRNERQALANLNHPSIPTLVDSGQLEDGRPFFICDYVEGVLINVYCERDNPSTTERLELLRGLGAAIQHAHTNLVLHLDIKPQNVLVQSDGTPMLLDFGVARLIGKNSGEHHAYSPGYASPEQIRGETLSAASDVYSLGALMYFLLAGEPPFSVPSQSPSETILAQRAEFVKKLDRADGLKGVDTDLRAIVQKAMTEHPSERYATVEALLRDLKYYRQGLPVAARPKTYAYRLSKYIRRHPVALGVAAVAFAALAAFGLREADLRRQAEVAQQEAESAYSTAEREAQTARQVSGFLINIFEVSDPSESRGSTVTARELLDNAAERIGDDLAGQPLVAARMMQSMGRVYSGLGLHKHATPMLEKALALRESTDDTASTDHADVLQSMGEQYDAVGRDADAQRALLAGLAIRERELGPKHRDVAESLIALGRVNTLMENFDEAEEQLLRALSINEELLGPNDPLLAQNLRQLGFLYTYLWRDKDAEKVLNRAVAIEEIRGSDHPGLATSLNDLAHTLKNLDRHEEAIATFERAMKIGKKIVGPDHPTIAKTLQRLGLTYIDLQDYDRAEQYFLKALAIREATLGPTHPATGFTVSALGDVYKEQGRLADAERMLTRSLAIMRDAHPEEHGNVSDQKYALAEVHRKRGQLDEAERLTMDAIENWSKTRAEDNQNLLDGQWQLANIYRDQARYDKAATIYARIFAAYEQEEDMSSGWAREVADEYAAFLKLRGEIVDPDRLFKRLRP